MTINFTNISGGITILNKAGVQAKEDLIMRERDEEFAKIIDEIVKGVEESIKREMERQFSIKPKCK